MVAQYEWLEKRTKRSVSNLRLWGENPRLDPDETYLTIKDYATEMSHITADRLDFIGLAKSIVTVGFVPGDPVVVWKDLENNKYYVAEGNRRILVLKLLMEPDKAPKSIKGTFKRLSDSISKKDIEKISVCVAPNFEAAEWYISQRNSTSTWQRRWTREQQLRWILTLYNKYDADTSIIKEKTTLNEPDIESILRTLKLKEIVQEIESKLSETEYEKATAINFPISTFERFINNIKVREAWGIEHSGIDIIFTKDKGSFLEAYAELMKRMFLPKNHENLINSRAINTSELIEKQLAKFPTVKNLDDENGNKNEDSNNSKTGQDETKEKNNNKPSKQIKVKPLKNDPYRSRLVMEIYELQTDDYRLDQLFEELTKIPIKRYQNAVAASIRLFLDLAVLQYIITEELKTDIQKEYTLTLRDINLKRRLEFLKKTDIPNECEKLISKLLNPSNELSLDVLNGYVHSSKVSHLTYSFLNRFWDFLFPLFEEFLEIKEIE